MEKTSFWKSELGAMCIAFIVLIVAFPVSLAGLNSGSDGILYLGLVLILAALLSAPVMMILKHAKKK